MNDSDDDEDLRGKWWNDDVYISKVGSGARVSRRIRRCDRARYLERVVFALIDLHMEHVKHGEVYLPDGVIIKREVWRLSTFQF